MMSSGKARIVEGGCQIGWHGVMCECKHAGGRDVPPPPPPPKKKKFINIYIYIICSEITSEIASEAIFGPEMLLVAHNCTGASAHHGTHWC